jgi:RNA 2',3'-cyclic 3'-phosphodiesterase
MSIHASGSGRLFLAVTLNPDAAAKAYRLGRILRGAHGFDCEPVKADRLHVTLFFLGDCSEQMVRLACEAASHVRMPAFEASFDRTMSFRRRERSYPLVLVGDDGLRRLKSFRQRLGSALAEKGLGRLARRDFTPHITLMYGEREVDEYPVEPVCWTVNEFVLIHSLDGHACLGRWRFDV